MTFLMSYRFLTNINLLLIMTNIIKWKAKILNPQPHLFRATDHEGMKKRKEHT